MSNRILTAFTSTTTLLFTTALLTSACGPEFDPRTSLSGYRMIGIQAEPPEVEVDDTVTLTSYDFDDGDEPITYRWSVCPVSFGAANYYECEVDEIEVDSDSPQLELDLSEDGIDLQAVLDDLGDVPNADGTPRSLQEGFDIYVRLLSGPDCSKCKEIETVKRVFVRNGASEAPNDNPVIEDFDVKGKLSPGEKLELSIDVDKPETYTDPQTGERETEEYLYTWYTTRGETEPGLTFGDDLDTELELPDDEKGELVLIVAVRDGRGGLAVSRQTLDID